MAPATASQPTDQLVWQGKILPIVTDVFTSINNLGVAIQNDDATSISKAGDQFSGELIRFQRVLPVPQADIKTAQAFAKGLKDLGGGSKTLAIALQAASRTGLQQAEKQLEAGLQEFQQAIDQVRSRSGPLAEPTVAPMANASPTATPVIRGLP
jgi:hypothetical protein